MTFILLILLATGLVIGTISGMLGIGGGIIMTPVQLWIYSSQGWSTEIAVKIAFATSLAVILPTAAAGVWRHHKHGDIKWKTAIFMGIFTSIGSFSGATLASHIPGATLKFVFGLLALIIAIRMLTLKINDAERPLRQNLWLWFGLALPIGFVTGLLGIGGGILVVPALVLGLRFRMREAAATSLGMMLFTSVGGIAGYIINGLHVSGMPAYTIGYIFWPGWIALTITSIFMTQIGAIAAHKIAGKKLNYLFVVLLFYISLDMLGVIDRLISLFKG
jgi:uncharacterized membrane protein YfcA